MDGDEQSSLNYFKELTDKIDEYKNSSLVAFFNDVAKAVTSLESYGASVNKVFGETRQRIGDIKTALADSLPGINRLGGDINSVQQTITEIALGTKRNIIATTKQTEELYAALKVTGVSVRSLVEGFADVGVGVRQMSKEIESSINYIQSIGGNTKEVFKVVTDNMSQLNRYQFDGGIKGLTKMVAQASMLRFDINETFRLADGLYKPERAIEVASAFQRLGLAVGDLADPFRLMNASIMDPQGLQDSLANVAKQFTYLDDKTKTFKITPEGVLRLKELQEQTQVSATEMMKLGIAAKEADARVSAISAVGLNVSEEDKQLLSNIARMGDGGEYEISVKDSESGERRWEKLTSLTQDQLNATLKEQKEGPKSLEDIARSQLDYSEMVAGDVRAIYNGFMYGFGSEGRVNETVEGIRRLTDTTTGTLSKLFGTTKTGRNMSKTAIDDIKQFMKDLNDPNKGKNEAFASLIEKVGKQSETYGQQFKDGMSEYLGKVQEKLTDKTYIESQTKDLFDQILGQKKKTTSQSPEMGIYSGLMGKSTPIDLGSRSFSRNTPGDGTTTSTTTKTTVDVGGKIQVEFTTQNGSELTRKMLDDWANSPQTKQYFMSLTAPQNPTKAPNKTSYGN
jgi:hypothetical protein